MVGCEGAPGSLGLRLGELESEEEEDDDDDDDEDEEDYDDEDVEEGIDICCPEELAQVLEEMPVSNCCKNLLYSFYRLFKMKKISKFSSST